jgi:hypothetical protein
MTDLIAVPKTTEGQKLKALAPDSVLPAGFNGAATVRSRK